MSQQSRIVYTFHSLASHLTHKLTHLLFITPNQFVWIMINFSLSRFLQSEWERERFLHAAASVKRKTELAGHFQLFDREWFLCGISLWFFLWRTSQSYTEISTNIGYEVNGISWRWKKWNVFSPNDPDTLEAWFLHIPLDNYVLFEMFHENSCWKCVPVVSLTYSVVCLWITWKRVKRLKLKIHHRFSTIFTSVSKTLSFLFVAVEKVRTKLPSCM